MTASAPRRFLRMPLVLEKTGLSRTRIFMLEKRGEFPARVKISTKACAHLEHEVEQWISARIAASRDPISTAAPPAEPKKKRPVGRPRKYVATSARGASSIA
jgi:prophage regulatory protein